MKNILLLVHDDVGEEARFQAALDLTRALDGHLTCVDVVPLPVMVGDFYSGASEAMLLADNGQRETVHRERIEARLAHEDVSCLSSLMPSSFPLSHANNSVASRMSAEQLAK